MSNPKVKTALNNAEGIDAVGKRTWRQVFNNFAGSALLVIGGVVTTVGAVQAQNHPEAAQQFQSAEEGVRGIHGQVQQVRRLSNREQNGTQRGTINLGSIAGAVIGGALGNQVGSGNGQKLATAVGALAGGSFANRVADRQQARNQAVPGYNNARRVEDNVVVTVAVRNGHTYESYEILQPAAIGLRRGDDVVLSTSPDGRQLIALPIQIEPQYETRRPRRR